MTKVNNKFGSKVNELFKLIEETEDWDKYVSDKTRVVVETLYLNQDMNLTLSQLNMKYTTARSHIIRAVDRIKNKKTNYLREGQSYKAQQLLNLMDKPNWKDNLTDKEIMLAKSFKKYKNFYEVARVLNVKPSNVASTLYGNSQKQGVISKIKEGS